MKKNFKVSTVALLLIVFVLFSMLGGLVASADSTTRYDSNGNEIVQDDDGVTITVNKNSDLTDMIAVSAGGIQMNVPSSDIGAGNWANIGVSSAASSDISTVARCVGGDTASGFDELFSKKNLLGNGEVDKPIEYVAPLTTAQQAQVEKSEIAVVDVLNVETGAYYGSACSISSNHKTISFSSKYFGEFIISMRSSAPTITDGSTGVSYDDNGNEFIQYDLNTVGIVVSTYSDLTDTVGIFADDMSMQVPTIDVGAGKEGVFALSDMTTASVASYTSFIGGDTASGFTVKYTVGARCMPSVKSAICYGVPITFEQQCQMSNGEKPVLYYFNSITGSFTEISINVESDNQGFTFTSSDVGDFVITMMKTSPSITAGSTGKGTSTPTTTIMPIGVSYGTYVQKLGWTKSVANGALSGTTGKSLRVEGFNATLTGTIPTFASIEYQAWVQNTGWVTMGYDGSMAGTSGKSLMVEAINMTITDLPGYSVKYRVYEQKHGWLAWKISANNTAIYKAPVAGAVDSGLRIEAIEVQLVKS